MAIQEPLAGIKVCGRPNFLHHKHHFKRFLSLSLSLVRKKWLCAIILRSRSILPAQLFKNHFGQQALMAICNAFADATCSFCQITTSFYRARNGKQMEFSLASAGLEMFIQAHARPGAIKTNSALCVA
jgi:hypothetical protein